MREALGLVWISVEDAPDAVFPIENEAEAEANQDYAFVFNNVDGDIRVWMDHHADVDHAAFTHVEWYYPGSAEAPPDVLELNYRVTPDIRSVCLFSAGRSVALPGWSERLAML